MAFEALGLLPVEGTKITKEEPRREATRV